MIFKIIVDLGWLAVHRDQILFSDVSLHIVPVLELQIGFPGVPQIDPKPIFLYEEIRARVYGSIRSIHELRHLFNIGWSNDLRER